MKDRQFDLEDSQGARLTCWLEDDARLKVGAVVTLKETGKRKWRIMQRYSFVVDDHALSSGPSPRCHQLPRERLKRQPAARAQQRIVEVIDLLLMECA